VACNPIPGPDDPPDYCARFYIDLFINPDPIPVSFPSGPPFSQIYFSRAGPIMPGQSEAYSPGAFALPPDAHQPVFLYVRVDNFNPERAFGLVPEYNELNNVFGPITIEHDIYLPIALHGY
jgi:hypothetical protein